MYERYARIKMEINVLKNTIKIKKNLCKNLKNVQKYKNTHLNETHTTAKQRAKINQHVKPNWRNMCFYYVQAHFFFTKNNPILIIKNGLCTSLGQELFGELRSLMMNEISSLIMRKWLTMLHLTQEN